MLKIHFIQMFKIYVWSTLHTIVLFRKQQHSHTELNTSKFSGCAWTHHSLQLSALGQVIISKSELPKESGYYWKRLKAGRKQLDSL